MHAGWFWARHRSIFFKVASPHSSAFLNPDFASWEWVSFKLRAHVIPVRAQYFYCICLSKPNLISQHQILPVYTGDTSQGSAAVNSNSMCLTGARSTLPLVSLGASIKANFQPGIQNAILCISAKSNWPGFQLTEGSIFSESNTNTRK